MSILSALRSALCATRPSLGLALGVALSLGTLAGCGSQGNNDHRLLVQVSVNDSVTPGSPVSNGDSSLELNSGDRLQLEDSAGIAVTTGASSVTVASLQSDESHWAANLVSSSDATIVLTIRSRIDASQSATLTVHVKAQPLHVDVWVNAGLVNAAPLVAGDTLLVNMHSGQTLTIKSSSGTAVTLDASGVHTSGLVESPLQWQGRLNAATPTEALISVTDLNDASHVVTLRVVLAPSSLALSVRLDGVLLNTDPILAGDVYSLGMASGQALDISGPFAITVSEALNGASKTGYTSTSQSWHATLASNGPTEVVLVVSDPADTSVSATVKIALDPLPMALNVAVAGVTVTDTPIVDGETRSFTIKSGQAVSLTSTGLRLAVGEALSNAVASARVSSPTGWGATLSSTATTEVTLTVRPQGDTTRVATVKLTVMPSPLSLSVTASGKLVNSTPLIAGETLNVALPSGDPVVIDSAVPMTVTETLNTAVRSNYTQTSTRYAANFTAQAGSQVVLTVAAVSEPALTATVVLSVAPQVYTSTLGRTSNEFSSFEATSTRVDGSTFNQSTTRRVTSVAPDGSYTSEIKVGVEVLYTEREDINGNLQVFNFQTTGKSCSYSPQRNLLDFPLYVGKSSSSSWSSTCTDGVSEYANASMQVQGVETVNIGSTAVQALRVQINVSVTGSNDPNLEGGDAGKAAYNQVWYCKWAIDLQRPMFCSYATTYIGAAPASYIAGSSDTMTQYVKP